jgi:hypothetical protein
MSLGGRRKADCHSSQGSNHVTADNAEPSGPSPDQFLAELEAQVREIEAAGGQPPREFKRQLERVKRMLAEGKADGVRFMLAGDGSSGLMGFSLPLEPRSGEEDPEEGAT